MASKLGKRYERIFTSVSNVVLVALIGFLAFGPNSRLAIAFGERRERARTRELIQEKWSELIGEGAEGGSTGGDKVVVEYFDYQCPFCRTVNSAIEDVLTAHDDVRVVYRHLPLDDIHPRARDASLAAICAERAGQFKELHEYLMEDTGWTEVTDWSVLGTAAGIENMVSFEECMADPATSARLDRDIALAEALGINATPTFVSQSGIIKGAVSADSLAEFVGY